MMNLGRYANTIIFCIAFLCLLDLPLTGAFPTMMERKTKGYFSQVSSPRLTIHHTIHHLPSRRHGMVALASASSSQESDHGETLMKISFSLKEGGADEETKATNILQSYIASFPFSAVLPVQPLTYLRREDGKGVDVSFLRKKTQEKGSIDGGIEFLISSSRGADEMVILDLVALRNGEGQSISKVFSEGLIIKSFVSGLYGEGEGGYVGKGKDEMFDVLSMEKVIHKWM